MTRKRLICLAVLSIVVLAVTLEAYNDPGEFLFNRGSSVFAIERAPLPLTLTAASAMLLIAGFAIRASSSLLLKIAAVALCLLWCLTGRVVALSWDGRLATGEFCMRLNTVHLRQEGEEMEGYQKYWAVKRLPAWGFELKSGERSEWIFVGPFLMQKTELLLRQGGFALSSDP